nr:type II secretion system protein [Vibrio sp. 23023]
MIVLMVIGYLLVAFAQKQKEQDIIDNQQSFYHHVTYLIAQINAFQSDQYASGILPDSHNLFPQDFAELQTKGYLAPCSTSDNRQGHCMKPEQTPWGQPIVYRRHHVTGHPYYEAIMTITLPPEDDANRFELQTTLSLFSKMSGVAYDSTRRVLTVHIPRLENLLSLTSLVKRSGQESTLTGDWDVGGGHAIVNAKDVQIRNADGSQRSLSVGLVDAITVKSDTQVLKPQCPAGLTADAIFTIRKVLLPTTAASKEYVNATVQPHVRPHAWTPKLTYFYHDATGHWVEGHDGYITAQTLCH